MINDERLLALAAELADRAGAEIRAIRSRGFEVQRKADRSLVTEADRAAEAIILAGLRAAWPDCPVIAEEEAAAGIVAEVGGQHSGWSIRWTARRNSPAAAMISPSTSVWSGMASLFWAWSACRRQGKSSAASSDRAHGVRPGQANAHHNRSASATRGADRCRQPPSWRSGAARCLPGRPRRRPHRSTSAPASNSAVWPRVRLIFTHASAARWSGTPAPRKPCWKPPAARCSRWRASHSAMASRDGTTRGSSAGAPARG